MNIGAPLGQLQPRLPRAVTASSSLGTIRPRIAELRRIVASPERHLPGLSEHLRVAQIDNHLATIARLEDMERAKAGTLSFMETQPIPTNTVRRATKAPLGVLNNLRFQLLTTLDAMRLAHRTNAANGVLLEDSSHVDATLAIMRGLLDEAQAAIHAQIESNLLMLYGDSTDEQAGEQEGQEDEAMGPDDIRAQEPAPDGTAAEACAPEEDPPQPSEQHNKPPTADSPGRAATPNMGDPPGAGVHATVENLSMVC